MLIQDNGMHEKKIIKGVYLVKTRAEREELVEDLLMVGHLAVCQSDE